jgi:hypothetical protein
MIMVEKPHGYDDSIKIYIFLFLYSSENAVKMHIKFSQFITLKITGVLELVQCLTFQTEQSVLENGCFHPQLTQMPLMF